MDSSNLDPIWYMVPWTHMSQPPNNISTGSAIFAQHTHVNNIDKQTDHATCDICSKRRHLCTLCMQCSLILSQCKFLITEAETAQIMLLLSNIVGQIKKVSVKPRFEYCWWGSFEYCPREWVPDGRCRIAETTLGEVSSGEMMKQIWQQVAHRDLGL